MMDRLKIEPKGNGHSVQCNDIEFSKITDKIEVIMDGNNEVNQAIVYVHLDGIEMETECEIISEQGYNRLKLLVDTLREKYEK